MHQILPRTLQRLSSGNPVSDQVRGFEQALDSAGFVVGLDYSHDDNDDDEQADGNHPNHNTEPSEEHDWIKKLVSTADDLSDLSYAEINQKRKQLTFQAFSDNGFIDKIHMVENLVEPTINAMYEMFKRTDNLAHLCWLPADAESEKDRHMSQSLGSESVSCP